MNAFYNSNKFVSFKIGAFVNVHNPQHFDQIGQIIDIDKRKSQLLIKITPKIDYKLLKDYNLQSQKELNIRQDPDYKIPQSFFNQNILQSKCKKAKLQISWLPNQYVEAIEWDGDKYIGRFLYKRFPFSEIEVVNVVKKSIFELYKANLEDFENTNPEILQSISDYEKNIKASNNNSDSDSSGIEEEEENDLSGKSNLNLPNAFNSAANKLGHSNNKNEQPTQSTPIQSLKSKPKARSIQQKIDFYISTPDKKNASLNKQDIHQQNSQKIDQIPQMPPQNSANQSIENTQISLPPPQNINEEDINANFQNILNHFSIEDLENMKTVELEYPDSNSSMLDSIIQSKRLNQPLQFDNLCKTISEPINFVPNFEINSEQNHNFAIHEEIPQNINNYSMHEESNLQKSTNLNKPNEIAGIDSIQKTNSSNVNMHMLKENADINVNNYTDINKKDTTNNLILTNQKIHSPNINKEKHSDEINTKRIPHSKHHINKISDTTFINELNTAKIHQKKIEKNPAIKSNPTRNTDETNSLNIKHHHSKSNKTTDDKPMKFKSDLTNNIISNIDALQSNSKIVNETNTTRVKYYAKPNDEKITRMKSDPNSIKTLNNVNSINKKNKLQSINETSENIVRLNSDPTYSQFKNFNQSKDKSKIKNENNSKIDLNIPNIKINTSFMQSDSGNPENSISPTNSESKIPFELYPRKKKKMKILDELPDDLKILTKSKKKEKSKKLNHQESTISNESLQENYQPKLSTQSSSVQPVLIKEKSEIKLLQSTAFIQPTDANEPEKHIEKNKDHYNEKIHLKEINQNVIIMTKESVDKKKNSEPVREKHLEIKDINYISQKLDKEKHPDSDKDLYKIENTDQNREKHRDLDRERHRDSDRERHHDSERDRHRDLERERHRDSDRERHHYSDRDRHRDSDRERHRDSDRERYRDSDRERHHDSDRERYRDSDRERYRDLERERYYDSDRERYRDSERERYYDSDRRRYRDSDRGRAIHGHRDYDYEKSRKSHY